MNELPLPNPPAPQAPLPDGSANAAPGRTERSLFGAAAIVISWLLIWAVVVGVLWSTHRAYSADSKAAADKSSAAKTNASTQPASVAPDDDEPGDDIETPVLPTTGPTSRAAVVTSPSNPKPATQPVAQAPSSDTDNTADTSPSLPMRMIHKYTVGSAALVGRAQAKDSIDSLRKSAQSPADRVAVAAIAGELSGAPAALAELDQLRAAGETTGLETETRLLRQIYKQGPATLTETEREWIRYRLGYAGEVAAVYGVNDTDPERTRVLNGGRAMVAVLLGVASAVILGMLVGLVLLILAVMQLVRRRLKVRYADLTIAAAMPKSAEASTASPAVATPTPPPVPVTMPAVVAPPMMPASSSGVGSSGWPSLPPVGGYLYPPAQYGAPMQYGMPTQYGMPPMMWTPPPIQLETYRFTPLGQQSPRTGPFIEAFALYLVGFLGMGLFGRYIGMDRMGFGWQAVAGIAPVVLALIWPKLRGCSWRQWRIGYGFVVPRGIFRELGSGIIAYFAGLPLLALSMVVVLILNAVTGITPKHPISETATDGVGPLILFLMAAVWAPITEEAFFRGGLFHRLRRGWGWIVSALVSSFIFAAVHPQGWTVIPALGMMGIILCAMREWRGSTIPGMAAHALHNGTLVLLLIVASA